MEDSKYEIHSLQMVCEGMFNRVGAVKKLIKLLLKQKRDIIDYDNINLVLLRNTSGGDKL